MLAAPGVYGSVRERGRKKWEKGKEKHKIFHEIETLSSHFTTIYIQKSRTTDI